MKSKLCLALIVCSASWFSLFKAYANECLLSKPNLIDPVGALKSSDNFGWFGSERLAMMIPHHGHWKGFKSWWWYKGYKMESRTAYKLKIAARNLGNGQEIVIRSPSDAQQGSDNYT